MSGWFIVIEEQSGNGEGRHWRVTNVAPAGDSEEAAQEVALKTAREYQPEHPWSPRRRQIYRMATPGEFLVAVEGRTATFHFRISVGQRVYDGPETGVMR
ncbi:hypothetical protein [Catenuloplanes atrovinosus]|uniref:Uncharacterized protein n=1 Tax=Catenuloplanes atrovinosus TaxID=137266 RepID=A0AAE3YZK2_9ACTN|nr:hypothetical protein [Catenuloplanes atrovinosus]MDR7281049.1 hypothetical protein [Catenuloplanes atrovinosus]